MSKHINLEEEQIRAKTAIPKVFYVTVSLLLQFAFFIGVLLFFRDRMVYFYTVCAIISAGTILYIIYDEKGNPAFKIAWLIPIALMPIFGGILYLIFGKYRMTKKDKAFATEMRRQISESVEQEKQYVRSDFEHQEAKLLAHFLYRTSGALPYEHTKTVYFPSGEKAYPAMLQDLEQAENYIFIQYFIMQEGIMWNGILDILKRKVAEGVDVRVMFDDWGCMFTLPAQYEKTLEAMGIHCCVVNELKNFLSPAFNNRDHRKMCIIDGKIAYTGGYNLADEYINQHERFGYWKDTGIRLEGRAAWSVTIQFLVQWMAISGNSDSLMKYHPNPQWMDSVENDGMVQAFSDIPLDGDHPGKGLYMSLISRAQNYVYITTPYLVPDYELLTALRNAAFSGVDVRIYTPHIPDKKIVFSLTRSYYETLMASGVKIFEFTPGFLHAKMLVSDDVKAIIGTINMDYRSLYLHNENAVFLYGNSAVMDIKNDILEMESASEQQQSAPKKFTDLPYHIFIGLLRSFAPLM